MDNIACANRASSLSKHGSPNPTGTFDIQQVTVPPMESFYDLTSYIFCIIFTEVLGCGHLVFIIIILSF